MYSPQKYKKSTITPSFALCFFDSSPLVRKIKKILAFCSLNRNFVTDYKKGKGK
jgi:hypothetical protein